MSEKAFPELQELHAQQDRYGKLNGFGCESVGGMTLRDYFAAKAMAAFIGRDMATEIDDRLSA